MVSRALSYRFVTEVLPTIVDDVSTTKGAMRPTDSTIECDVTKDKDTTEGGPTTAVAESGNGAIRLLMIFRFYAPHVCFTQIQDFLLLLCALWTIVPIFVAVV